MFTKFRFDQKVKQSYIYDYYHYFAKIFLEHLDDKLKGSEGIFQVLILELLWILTIFQVSSVYAIFFLLFTARREFNPSHGRCFNFSLWMLSGPGAEFFFVAWIARVSSSFEKG